MHVYRFIRNLFGDFSRLVRPTKKSVQCITYQKAFNKLWRVLVIVSALASLDWETERPMRKASVICCGK